MNQFDECLSNRGGAILSVCWFFESRSLRGCSLFIIGHMFRWVCENGLLVRERRKRRDGRGEESERKTRRRGKRAADSQSAITWTRRHAPPPFPASDGEGGTRVNTRCGTRLLCAVNATWRRNRTMGQKVSLLSTREILFPSNENPFRRGQIRYE